MTSLALLGIVWWANTSPIHVEGSSRCPTPAEIEARLPDLLPAGGGDTAGRDTAWVDVEGTDLLITLRGSGGDVLLQRRLAGNSEAAAANCAERAAAAAVVIATWEMDRRPELSPPLPAPPPLPVAPPARAEPTTVRAVPTTEEPAGPRFDLALALGTSASTTGLAGTGDIEFGARARQRRWGLGLMASSDTERAQSLDGGQVKWRRMAVGLGPSVRLFEGTVAVEARAQILAGFLTVHGQGYDQDHEASDLSLGIAGAARVVAGRGRWRPFLEVGGKTWLAARGITIAAGNAVAARTALPRIEERLTIGLRVLIGE